MKDLFVGKNIQHQKQFHKISEYPSSSTCICAAHAHAIRKFRNSDELNLKVTFPKGSSGVEPGKFIFTTVAQKGKVCNSAVVKMSNSDGIAGFDIVSKS